MFLLAITGHFVRSTSSAYVVILPTSSKIKYQREVKLLIARGPETPIAAGLTCGPVNPGFFSRPTISRMDSAEFISIATTVVPDGRRETERNEIVSLAKKRF